MKKKITLKGKKFSNMVFLVSFIIAALFITSCTKEDIVFPSTSSGNQSGVAQAPDKYMSNLNNSIAPPVTIPSDAVIYISHGPCLGWCANYTVKVTRDGNVTYEGKGDVKTFGIIKFNIATERAFQLGNIMIGSGFLDLKDAYPYVPDLSQTITAYNFGEIPKIVVDYGKDVPDNLITIRTTIESILGIDKLVTGTVITPPQGDPKNN